MPTTPMAVQPPETLKIAAGPALGFSFDDPCRAEVCSTRPRHTRGDCPLLFGFLRNCWSCCKTLPEERRHADDVGLCDGCLARLREETNP